MSKLQYNMKESLQLKQIVNVMSTVNTWSFSREDFQHSLVPTPVVCTLAPQNTNYGS